MKILDFYLDFLKIFCFCYIIILTLQGTSKNYKFLVQPCAKSKCHETPSLQYS